MNDEKRTNVINFIQDLNNKVMNKLDNIISNQRSIKADTNEIGRMLQGYYKQSNIVSNGQYRGQFVIKNMTDSQAKDLLVKQGVPAHVVAQLSDNKFTVQYLVNLMKK